MEKSPDAFRTISIDYADGPRYLALTLPSGAPDRVSLHDLGPAPSIERLLRALGLEKDPAPEVARSGGAQ